MSWQRVFRLALRVLPADLRGKHGDDMTDAFARDLDRARRKGPLSTWRTGLGAVGDVLGRGLYDRWRRRTPSRPRHGSQPSHRGVIRVIDTLGQDLAHGVRSLRRAPGFAVVAVLTLSLGVAATTAMFSVLHAVVMRPLPLPDAGRMVHLAWDAGSHLQSHLSATKFRYWREHATAFEAMATWVSYTTHFGESGAAAPVRALRVSADFLDVLQYPPSLGRDFTAAEASGAEDRRVAIVSRAVWRSLSASDGDGRGRTMRLDGETYTVIGVLPESFAFPYETETDDGIGPVGMLVPLRLTADPADVAENWPTIARLRAGVTRVEADADVRSLTESFRNAHPAQANQRDRGMILATFSELYVGNGSRPLWISMGAVTVVLLIACANIGNLFLARAARRRGEIALRAALGATRGRLVRLVLGESLLVSLAAAVLGLLLADWGVGILVALSPVHLPRMETVGMDAAVIVFAVTASLVTGLVVGTMTSLAAASAPISPALKESSRGGTHRGGRSGLLAAQSALSTVLLVGAGLLLVTLKELRRVDTGFDHRGLVAVRFASAPAGYETSTALWELQRRIAALAERTPSIAAIAGATNLPLERGVNVPVSIDGSEDGFIGSVEWRAVTPGYFEALGIDGVTGRDIRASDNRSAPRVTIVNQTFARRHFPGDNPLGRTVQIGRPGTTGQRVEIVGIVADIREVSLRREPRRTLYVPQAQAPDRLSTLLHPMPVFLVRARLDIRAVERALAEAFRKVDPTLPPATVLPISDVIEASLTRERFGATLLSLLATVAVVLTALGIYGVLTYAVRQRHREIGIRMALGANGRAVTRMVVMQGLTPIFLGLVAGTAASLAISRAIAAYLWGVPPHDPRTFATVGIILLAVAAFASWWPAREAATLDPVRSLAHHNSG